MSNDSERPPIRRDLTPIEILDRLQRSLLRSFEQIKEMPMCAVLFSGGVDSSLAAVLTKRECKDTTLFTARCDNSHDAKASVDAAAAMSIDIIEVRIDSESLWEILPDVIRCIGRSNRMDVEIAIPFFFATREAKRLGFNLMVSGQGPDELFGGYARYEKIMVEKGPEEVENALWRDVLRTDEMNIQRDMRIMSHHSLQAFFPYLYPDFVRLALSIPAAMNIDPNKKPGRKIIFRRLAQVMGVPDDITMEQKRATQYSSGTSKMLVEAVRDHIKEAKKRSKHEIHIMIQDILNQISRQQLVAE